MPSPTERGWRPLEAREKAAMDATNAFLDWAKGRGRQHVMMDLALRDCAILCAVVAYHGATLAAEGGDPELMLYLAADMAGPLRHELGAEEANRILQLVSIMITGLE